MLRIGLTGGIASGKTTVSDLFRARGVPVVDADELAHALVAPGQPALEAIVQRFGRGVLRGDGTLDRATLRERVFADTGERRALEAILHPAIRAATAERLAGFERAGAPYAINVVPLLLETGLVGQFDRIAVVDVPRAVQLARLMARDGSDAAAAESILQAQSTREARLAIADDVIVNDGDLAALQSRVVELHLRYLALAAARDAGAASSNGDGSAPGAADL